jgi:two-component system NtrC family response regulator
MTDNSAGTVPRKTGSILVVEDDPGLRRLTQLQLEKLGYQTKVAYDVASAEEALRMETPDLVICDLHLPGPGGLDLLRAVRAEHPAILFVVVTAYGSIDSAVEAMKLGAFDYLTKPLNVDELRMLVSRAFGQRDHAEGGHIVQGGFEGLLGKSPALSAVINVASRAARTDAPVLITGETGTGKEVLARAIHVNSDRRDRPFVIVNCGAIPRELVESELFGHVKGAFTGASVNKKGKAEMADGGTLFLDEIGEMPLEMQVRLLRLIQHGEIQKVGAATPIQVDARVIAATHRNVEQLVESGHFREDLYYRLLVVPIELPPLRARREDIPDLVRHFLKESKEKHHRPTLELPEHLIRNFTRYDWPGNVRQLANCILRIVVLTAGDEVTLEDLPPFLRKGTASEPLPPAPGEKQEDATLDALEKKAIREALEKTDWNQTRAAVMLGVTRKTLRGRMARFHLAKPGALGPDSELDH